MKDSMPPSEEKGTRIDNNGNNNENNAKSYISDFSRKILIITGLLFLILIAYAIRKVLTAVTIAIVLFYVLDPLTTFLSKPKTGGKFSISRTWAVIISFIIATAIVTLILIFFIPPMIEQIKNLPGYKLQIQEIFTFLVQKAQELKLPPEVQDIITNLIERTFSGSMAIVRRLAKGTAFALLFSHFILLFLIPFITFYMLIEKDSVTKTVVDIFPKRYQEEIGQILNESSLALRGYITGQFILGVLMGIFITFLLWIMGIKAPLFFGFIAGVTKLIPVVGIFLGCLPAVLATLSTSKMLALWVILIFILIQLLENKLILPMMLSRYVDLSPLTILCALIIGEQLAGVLGMFISTPIAAVLRVLYIHIRKRYD